LGFCEERAEQDRKTHALKPHPSDAYVRSEVFGSLWDDIRQQRSSVKRRSEIQRQQEVWGRVVQGTAKHHSCNGGDERKKERQRDESAHDADDDGKALVERCGWQRWWHPGDACSRAWGFAEHAGRWQLRRSVEWRRD
jgi:hypothetical protein